MPEYVETVQQFKVVQTPTGGFVSVPTNRFETKTIKTPEGPQNEWTRSRIQSGEIVLSGTPRAYEASRERINLPGYEGQKTGIVQAGREGVLRKMPDTLESIGRVLTSLGKAKPDVSAGQSKIITATSEAEMQRKLASEKKEASRFAEAQASLAGTQAELTVGYENELSKKRAEYSALPEDTQFEYGGTLISKRQMLSNLDDISWQIRRDREGLLAQEKRFKDLAARPEQLISTPSSKIEKRSSGPVQDITIDTSKRTTPTQGPSIPTSARAVSEALFGYAKTGAERVVKAYETVFPRPNQIFKTTLYPMNATETEKALISATDTSRLQAAQTSDLVWRAGRQVVSLPSFLMGAVDIPEGLARRGGMLWKNSDQIMPFVEGIGTGLWNARTEIAKEMMAGQLAFPVIQEIVGTMGRTKFIIEEHDVAGWKAGPKGTIVSTPPVAKVTLDVTLKPKPEPPYIATFEIGRKQRAGVLLGPNEVTTAKTPVEIETVMTEISAKDAKALSEYYSVPREVTYTRTGSIQDLLVQKISSTEIVIDGSLRTIPTSKVTTLWQPGETTSTTWVQRTMIFDEPIRNTVQATAITQLWLPNVGTDLTIPKAATDSFTRFAPSGKGSSDILTFMGATYDPKTFLESSNAATRTVEQLRTVTKGYLIKIEPVVKETVTAVDIAGGAASATSGVVRAYKAIEGEGDMAFEMAYPPGKMDIAETKTMTAMAPLMTKTRLVDKIGSLDMKAGLLSRMGVERLTGAKTIMDVSYAKESSALLKSGDILKTGRPSAFLETRLYSDKTDSLMKGLTLVGVKRESMSLVKQLTKTAPVQKQRSGILNLPGITTPGLPAPRKSKTPIFGPASSKNPFTTRSSRRKGASQVVFKSLTALVGGEKRVRLV